MAKEVEYRKNVVTADKKKTSKQREGAAAITTPLIHRGFELYRGHLSAPPTQHSRALAVGTFNVEYDRGAGADGADGRGSEDWR